MRPELQASVYLNGQVAESSAIEVIHGEKYDRGSVVLQIGGAAIHFSSVSALVQELTQDSNGNVTPIRAAG